MKVIYSEDGTRRIVIWRSEHGFFGFDEERFMEDENISTGEVYRYWCPVPRDSFSMCETEEIAESEARCRIGWLAGEASEP